MAESGPQNASVDQVERDLDRIGAAVAQGRTDLGPLGFWKAVDRIKRDPALAERFADAAGRIDRDAFERWARIRLPVWLGNAVLAAGTVAGAAAIVVAGTAEDDLIKGLALLASAGILTVSTHCLGHWVVGRAVGIRFVSYSPGGPLKVTPTLKIEYGSYLRTPANARAWMHASGAIASKLAPFVSLAFWPLIGAPSWAGLGVLGIGLLQILTDAAWSTKHSDWKKFLRERRYATGS